MSHLGPPDAGRMLALQRLAGNASVGRLLVRRWPWSSAPPRSDTELRDRALAPGGTSDDAIAIRDFSVAADDQKADLMRLIMTDWWVGPNGESALERCWGSFSKERLVAFATAHPELWDQCIDRGAALEDLPAVVELRTDFTGDVRDLARHYMTHNREVVQTEFRQYGLDPAGGAGPSPARDEELRRLQESARALADLQRAQEQAREARVGWRIGDGGEVDADWTGRQVRYQVKFDPRNPPPLRTDPGDAYPQGEVLIYPIRPYDELLRAYQEATEAINDLVAVHPALYALSRAGLSGATAQFADMRDPNAARQRLRSGLDGVLNDIRRTEDALNTGRLDPLDLTPLHAQLHAATAPGVDNRWQSGFRRRLATDLVGSHNIDRALTELGFQVFQQAMFLAAPLTGGTTLIVLLSVTAAVSVGRAVVTAEDFQTLQTAQGTAVTPGSAVVTDEQVDHASQVAEASAVAAALATLALVGELVAGGSGGSGSGSGSGSGGGEPPGGGGPPPGPRGSGLPVRQAPIADLEVTENVVGSSMELELTWNDPVEGTYSLGTVSIDASSGVPRARMGLNARATIRGTEHAVRIVDAAGNEISVTRHAIDTARARYAQVFGQEIHAFDGQLGAQNLANFRREFGRARIRLGAANPGWSPEQLNEAAAQEAIRRVSFGEHRAAAGYADFRIDLGDLRETDFGGTDGRMLAPTTVDVQATLRPLQVPAP